MSKGWIRLHRDIFDNFLYTERPFCRVAAFVDLILLCSHDDNELLFDGEIMTVKRGQVLTSVRKLAERWGWSRTKIVKYLKVLEAQHMVIKQSDKKKTLLTLINYGKYQDYKDTEKTQERQRNDSEMTQKNTINNLNNFNNEKNDIYTGQTDFDKVMFACSKHQITDAITQQIAMRQYLQVMKLEDVLSCIQRSANKPVAYLLKVLQTKQEEQKNATPVKPFVRKTEGRRDKPRMTMNQQQESGQLTDQEREELQRMIEGGSIL